MENKKTKGIIVLLVLFLIGITLVSAEGVGISNEGVEYDSELIDQFLLNKWVYVTVDVKDFSNITIDYKEDSVEVQTIKDNQRWDTYRNTSEAVLSILSKDEFQLEGKLISGRAFYGNITKEGFEKLLRDTRVKKIYAEKDIHGFSTKIIKNLFMYIIPILLITILIILLIKYGKKRKWKLIK